MNRLYDTSFRSIVNFIMKISRYPMQHIRLTNTKPMAISSQERDFFIQLGARIAKQRNAREITQVQLAETLGVSQQTINSYEVGRRRIPVSALPILADLLDMSIDELLNKQTSTAATGKRGPASKLQKQIEQIRQLPRTQQTFVSKMLETVILQAH